jgi:hypothetical protein
MPCVVALPADGARGPPANACDRSLNTLPLARKPGSAAACLKQCIIQTIGCVELGGRRSLALRPRKPAAAYLRLRTLPGEQAQVDWGHFGSIQIGRAKRPLMAFVMALSWSRQIFLRFYLNQRMESFLRGHVAAFETWCKKVLNPCQCGYQGDESGLCHCSAEQVAATLRIMKVARTLADLEAE